METTAPAHVKQATWTLVSGGLEGKRNVSTSNYSSNNYY